MASKPADLDWKTTQRKAGRGKTVEKFPESPRPYRYAYHKTKGFEASGPEPLRRRSPDHREAWQVENSRAVKGELRASIDPHGVTTD